MGNFMMCMVFALFCLLFLLVLLSVFFDTDKLAKGIMLTCIVLLLLSLILLFRAGVNLKKENIGPMHYGENEKFINSLSL